MAQQDKSQTGSDVRDDAADEETGLEAGQAGADQAVAEKLDLDVKIDSRSACERHITVTIPREDIDRYFSNAFSELMDKAAVPGFRAGRAPRKLVELRFRKDVADQVKGSLLMDSLGQISESHDMSPISEPEFDPTAIVVPEEGPMTFEFDIEVRPEFDLPNWKGLQIEKPVREFSAEDVEKQLQNLLARHGKLVPFDGAAEPGDYLSLNLTFKDGETEISSVKEEIIRIRPVLSFRDGKVEGFAKLMQGAQAGETRVGKAKLSDDAPNEQLRGKEITAEFEVLEVKKLELPELSHAFLEQLGDFESEADLRDAIKDNLDRRLAYEQQRRARQQILAALTEAADWDLPPALLKRQSRRELERSVLELRRSGFGEEEIRAHENELRQNSRVNTARALKEHFILERIAEEQGIEDLPQDYDDEIVLIARQSGESPRRVRAQLEKRGLMDTLRNQIIERKAIDLILESAKFKDVPYEIEGADAEAIDQSAGGEDEEIPEAHEAGEAAQAPYQQEHR
ncbi:MAG TPA: trigger factor [Pirellulales bacterium]|jgi:trigger factor|nr:trigger factor [Pirellulales bacterium]